MSWRSCRRLLANCQVAKGRGALIESFVVKGQGMAAVALASASLRPRNSLSPGRPGLPPWAANRRAAVAQGQVRAGAS